MPEQRELAAEVVVHHGGIDSDLIGYFPQGCSCIALAGKKNLGGILDFLPDIRSGRASRASLWFSDRGCCQNEPSSNYVSHAHGIPGIGTMSPCILILIKHLIK